MAQSTHKHGGKRPNAGRPRSGRVRFWLQLRPEVAAMIDTLAFQNTKSRGEIVELQFTHKGLFTGC